MHEMSRFREFPRAYAGLAWESVLLGFLRPLREVALPGSPAAAGPSGAPKSAMKGASAAAAPIA